MGKHESRDCSCCSEWREEYYVLERKNFDLRAKTDELVLRIGKFYLSRRVHGGIWLRKEGGEGGRVIGPNLRVLEDMLEQFWETWF